MLARHRILSAAVAAAVALGPMLASGARAQGDNDTPFTDLTFSGGLTGETTGSDANACVLDTDGSFRAQLTSVGEASILSFDLGSATEGTFPLGTGGGPRVDVVSLSDDPNELLVNWSSRSGSLTISSLDTQVPVGDGSVATRGASGNIDAELAADRHGTLHISGAWACHMPF